MIMVSPMKLKTHSNCIVTQHWPIPLKKFHCQATGQTSCYVSKSNTRKKENILFLNVNSPFNPGCLYIYIY